MLGKKKLGVSLPCHNVFPPDEKLTYSGRNVKWKSSSSDQCTNKKET
jgi:hypothetical protein